MEVTAIRKNHGELHGIWGWWSVGSGYRAERELRVTKTLPS